MAAAIVTVLKPSQKVMKTSTACEAETQSPEHNIPNPTGQGQGSLVLSSMYSECDILVPPQLTVTSRPVQSFLTICHTAFF